MAHFLNWLARVLAHGESVQESPPVLVDSERAGVNGLLAGAFEQYSLDLAGPKIAFDAETATDAAIVLANACWNLVAGSEEPANLTFAKEPLSASQHASADLALRLLPTVHRRAKFHRPKSPLIGELERILRAWPLSGVLANLEDEPTADLEFGGHAGLQMLYAERLIETDRTSWLPPEGPARSWVERIYWERGKPMPQDLPEPRDGF